MLLRALYDLAQHRRLLDDVAFRLRPVRWIVPIDAFGHLVGPGLLDTADKEHKKGVEYLAPSTIRAKDAGGVAEFLADGLTSVFGLDTEPDALATMHERKHADRRQNNARKHRDFWSQVARAADRTDSPIARALLEFQRHHAAADESAPRIELAEVLRWGAGTESDAKTKAKWWVRNASGGEAPLGPGDIFTFQVDGHLVLDDIALRSHWSAESHAERHAKTESASRGLCLVTGIANAPIAATNPKIKGVPGALAMGANLVSFDKGAFTSFGFDQGENAPISLDAATAYGAAMNRLLEDEVSHIRLGPSALCFWAKEHTDFSAGIMALLNSPLPQTVADFFRRWLGGIETSDVGADRFYAVALCGNGGRVVVRHWIDQPLVEAARNMRRWFDDLLIAEIPKALSKSSGKRGDKKETPPLSVFRLACATVRDAKDLLAETVTRLCRAALEGRALPVSLLKPIIHRFRCDLVKSDTAYPWNPSRFALLKLILTRLARERGDAFMPQERLIADTNDIPYNLGRLLAVLEQLQDKAHEYKLEGAGVIERYYGTASSAPAGVFPLLCRLARHHLKKLENQGDKGKSDARFIEVDIQNILTRFEGDPPSFPRVLNLEKQGRFALGFYQQKAHTAQAIAAAKARRDNE